MNKIRGKRGISKAEWIEAGLNALREEGRGASLTIESLAKSLGISKAGFYWHFKNRNELMQHLLDHWVYESTSVVTSNEKLLELDPKTRLIKAAEMVVDLDLALYDLAIRQWGLGDATVARSVKQADEFRLGFVRTAFAELGFTGDDLEMRTMLFVCYQTWEATMFKELSRDRRRSLIAKRIELMTGKSLVNDSEAM